MDYQTFLAAVAADQKAIAQGRPPAGMVTCVACDTPLQEAITGNRELGDGTHMCSDCYFEALGKELDAHPISALRVSRPR